MQRYEAESIGAVLEHLPAGKRSLEETAAVHDAIQLMSGERRGVSATCERPTRRAYAATLAKSVPYCNQINSFALINTWARSFHAETSALLLPAAFACCWTKSSQALTSAAVGSRAKACRYILRMRFSSLPSLATIFCAHLSACCATNGSFISISACAGTLETVRRPTVENGIGVSKACKNDERKFRRIDR